MDKLHRVKKHEWRAIARVFADAFANDIMWRAVAEKFRIPAENMWHFYAMMLRYCLRYGEVYASSHKCEGAMAFTSQERANMTTWGLIRSGAIFPTLRIMKVGKKMMPLFKQIEEDRKTLDIGPYFYLNILGVAQQFQGKGFGGHLLRGLIERAERQGKAIYLETQTPENVNLYGKFGFQVMKEFTIPEMGLPMWELVRYPGARIG